MCGIAGWLDWNINMKEERNTLKKMQECQQRRGPDESGEWISQDIGLMHRRLIVIDPDGGKQPMVREKDGEKYVIIYNGELYNTPELHKKLRNRGYTFSGHSDTEALLLSFIEWGEDCVQYLNGIYAFAIWSERREKLFMARDRIGVKPLFYARRRDGIIFASELKGILANPLVEPVIDEQGLAEVMIMGPGRTPGHGVFSDVNELKPGYTLTFDRDGLRTRKYWELKSEPHEDSLEETANRVRELFVDTVERQLVSDVPICTLLSGGLDSSAITSIASNALRQAGKKQLHTYSIDYEGNDEHFEANEFQPDSDNKWIKVVSDYADTIHHNVILPNSRLVDGLTDGVLARDLPGMADIDVSLLLFCQEIEKEFTVAVSGECADEIFGGYPWFHRKEALQAETFPWSRRIDSRIQFLSDDIVQRIKPQKYLDYRYQQALDEVPRLPGEDDKNAKMREMFYLNLTRWMPILLDRKDRMSMFTSLEVRVPFCDHRLVEYVWNIPWSMKNYAGMRKGILREALKGLLPEGVRTRPKNPYPKTFDPAYFKATRTQLLQIMSNPNSPLLSLIDVDTIRNLTKADQDFDIPWFGQLMRLPQLFAYLIQINYWFEEYGVKIG